MQQLQSFTIHADLAVTIGVTGLEEGHCLGVGQCPCTSLEVLQEQPAGKQPRVSQSCTAALDVACR